MSSSLRSNNTQEYATTSNNTVTSVVQVGQVFDQVHIEAQNYIARSLLLDFSTRPRPNPFASSNNSDGDESTGSIKLLPSNRSRATERYKWSVLCIALSMQCMSLSVQRRYELIEAILTMQAYLCGYRIVPISTPWFIRRYLTRFLLNFRTNPVNIYGMFPIHDGQRNSDVNRHNYVDIILEQDPTCLHRLYRYATNVIGTSANVESLVEIMNQRAHVMYPNCPIRSNLKLTKHHFWVFSIGLMVVLFNTQPGQD